MNRRTLNACCLAALLASGGLAAQEPTAQADPPPETEIASINGQPFSLGLFRLFYAERQRQLQAEGNPAFQNQVFNEFVNIVVTAQDAASKGIDKNTQVQDALELQRLQLLSRLALQDAATSFAPSEEKLKEAYDERYGSAKRTEYKARHILVKTEDEAKELITQLEGGTDFSALAKEKSLGPTGKTGGDLGWFDANQMVKPFSDAVAKLEPNNYTKTPVQTQFGWHVILLEETREADPPALETVKLELASTLQRESLANHVSKLREGAKLELNEDLIKFSKDTPNAPE